MPHPVHHLLPLLLLLEPALLQLQGRCKHMTNRKCVRDPLLSKSPNHTSQALACQSKRVMCCCIETYLLRKLRRATSGVCSCGHQSDV